MSRLLPGSLAGRMTLVLVAGMPLVVVAGIAVGTVTMGGGQASLGDRVVTLVAVAEATPAAVRPAVYAGVERAGLSIRDLAGTDASPPVSPDWFTDRLVSAWPRELRLWALGCWPLATGRGGRPPMLASGTHSRLGRVVRWDAAAMVVRGRWSPLELDESAGAHPVRDRHRPDWAGRLGGATHHSAFGSLRRGDRPVRSRRRRSGAARREGARARSVRSRALSTLCRRRSVDCWRAVRTCWRPSRMICARR